MATATAIHNIGKVVQVIGPVLDVEFEAEHLPELYNALEINATSESGEPIVDTGGPITVPVGAPALGRILNVLGQPVDNGAEIPKTATRWPIHRKRPDF